MACRRHLLNIAGIAKQPYYWSHDTWLCGIATALRSRGYMTEPLIQHRRHGRNTSWFLWPKTGFQSIAYKIDIPPFTASTDFDCFLDFYATAADISNALKSQIQIAAKLGNINVDDAMESFSRRKAILDFVADERYGGALFRMQRCAALFTSNAYRAGGGFPGLARDILGRRRRAMPAARKDLTEGVILVDRIRTVRTRNSRAVPHFWPRAASAGGFQFGMISVCSVFRFPIVRSVPSACRPSSRKTGEKGAAWELPEPSVRRAKR